jgi:hypothetical protein
MDSIAREGARHSHVFCCKYILANTIDTLARLGWSFIRYQVNTFGVHLSFYLFFGWSLCITILMSIKYINTHVLFIGKDFSLGGSFA